MAVVATQVHHPAAPRRAPAVHLPIAVAARRRAVRHRLALRAVPVLRPVHRLRLHQAQALHQVRHQAQVLRRARVAAVLVASLAIT